MKKRLLWKIPLGILLSIFALLLVVWGGLNLIKFALFSTYYGNLDRLCRNPGLGDGFICQGISAVEEEGVILTSGYMKDGSASRIYITNEENESRFVKLQENGKDFVGHACGLAVTGGQVYLANEDSHLYVLSLEEVLQNDVVEIRSSFEVNNHASYVFTDDVSLYVGEFHDGTHYICEHENETEDGVYMSIVTRYDLQDLRTPKEIWATRNKVQGICFTNGKVVLSTSYGLAASEFYIYEEDKATESGKELDGAPVYYLDHALSSFSGPSMSEDLDVYQGKVITLFESASNKYLFGKFFFANYIASLDIL